MSPILVIPIFALFAGAVAGYFYGRRMSRMRKELIVALTYGEGTAFELAFRVERLKGHPNKEPSSHCMRDTYHILRSLVREGIASEREGPPLAVRNGSGRFYYRLTMRGHRVALEIDDANTLPLVHPAHFEG
jgi:hypothetical protein